jgi:hypothetical protein
MRRRSWHIGMGPRKGKRTELERWLGEHGPAQIGETEFEELRRALGPVSETYLRKLLRDSGVPLAIMVEGVRQSSFAELEASLLKFLDEYERGDPARRAAVRRAVITAKDHARLAARNPEKHAEKQEMLLWLLTWLENPPLFGDWVRLRRSFTDASLCPPSPLE